jgi:hypothetical protein
MGYLLKFLIFFLAIWVVISFVKKLAGSDEQKKHVGPDKASETMVQCEICGVYTPDSKTSSESGKIICANCQKQKHD